MYEILNDRSIIEITGLDTIKFLQNLTTNDISKTNCYTYTYMLSSQGRFLFDCFVFIVDSQRVIVDINTHVSEAFSTHLNLYKLRAKITIKNVSDLYQVLYSHQQLTLQNLVSYHDPRYKGLGIRTITSRHCESTQEINNRSLQDKYNFSIVDGYEDLIYNKSIPIEYGANELNAISYDKGCYIGQEIISRAKYQGVIRKTIFKLEADQDISHLPPGAEILAGDNKIGVICSSFQNKAITLIREAEYLANEAANIIVCGIKVNLSKPVWR